MIVRSAIALLALLLVAGLASQARAIDQLIADLSKDSIEITTAFSGTDVLLFGAIEGEGDIMVVVRGPETDMVVRRKERVAGIWINRANARFEKVPSFYYLATTGALHETVSADIIAHYGIGADHFARRPGNDLLPGRKASFRAGMIRTLKADDLFRETTSDIEFLAPGLFSVRLFFPANVVTGVYDVQVFLLRDNAVVSKRNYSLVIRKIGIGAEVFRFAHQHPAAYGGLAIAVALLAGWLAGLVFRRA